jgi:hypothetical protein
MLTTEQARAVLRSQEILELVIAGAAGYGVSASGGQADEESSAYSRLLTVYVTGFGLPTG